jgi:hypothetical protein
MTPQHPKSGLGDTDTSHLSLANEREARMDDPSRQSKQIRYCTCVAKAGCSVLWSHPWQMNSVLDVPLVVKLE